MLKVLVVSLSFLVVQISETLPAGHESAGDISVLMNHADSSNCDPHAPLGLDDMPGMSCLETGHSCAFIACVVAANGVTQSGFLFGELNRSLLSNPIKRIFEPPRRAV
jgi:hypothetical protein